jgi:hypothetical protein
MQLNATAWEPGDRIPRGRDTLEVAEVRASDEPTTFVVRLDELGVAPIGHITFHSLRRTYASLRCASGDDVRYAADQLGHEDPVFTLRVYAQAATRRDRMAKAQADAFDRTIEWPQLSHSQTGLGSTAQTTDLSSSTLATENP